MKVKKSKYDYIEQNVNSGHWSLTDAGLAAYDAANRLRKKRRIPELEKWIINVPSKAADYAKSFLGQRWIEAESVILRGSPKVLYSYVQSCVKIRWKEAEASISNSPEYSYKYAKDFLKKRWPEAEKTIIRDSANIEKAYHFYVYYCFKYARDVIGDRWLELENKIINNPRAMEFYAREVLGDELPEELHNRMLCYVLSSDSDKSNCVKQYLEFTKNIKIDFIKKLKRFDPNLSVKEVLEKMHKLGN